MNESQQLRYTINLDAHQWKSKMRLQAVGYHPIVRGDILAFAVRWVQLEDVTVSEINQKQKDKYHVFSLANGCLKNNYVTRKRGRLMRMGILLCPYVRRVFPYQKTKELLLPLGTPTWRPLTGRCMLSPCRIFPHLFYVLYTISECWFISSLAYPRRARIRMES